MQVRPGNAAPRPPIGKAYRKLPRGRFPMTDYPTPPYPEQQQAMPGTTAAMDPRPDHGEHSYVGHGRLTDRVAIVTGGDSGIGR